MRLEAEIASVSITLTRYREPDWLVLETLESLAKQRGVRGDVVFLDQSWRADFAETVEALSTGAIRFSCKPCPRNGLSHARNLGLEAAHADIVLFIDPDGLAAPDWAAELASALKRTGAGVVGARVLPKWRGRKPVLAFSKVVMDQYSLLDWGEETMSAPRVVGAGFGVRKSAAPAEMYFDEALGRRDGKLFGGEETDLCARVAAAGGGIAYCGSAVLHHQILPERLTWKWVLRRLYYAGLGRAQRGGAPSPSHAPGVWDWLLAPVILPPYALGYFRARRLARAVRPMAQ